MDAGVCVVKIYAAAIAALKGKDFEFMSLVLQAENKTAAKRKAMQLCKQLYPREHGYKSHKTSVTEVLSLIFA